MGLLKAVVCAGPALSRGWAGGLREPVPAKSRCDSVPLHSVVLVEVSCCLTNGRAMSCHVEPEECLSTDPQLC